MDRRRYLFFCILILLLFFSACKGREKEPKSLQADEVVRIDKQIIKAGEIAIYGIQVKKEFEQIGGVDVWEFESFSGDKSAYEVAKTKVLENLIRVKILATKAKERKMELDAEERAQVKQGAEGFFEDKEVSQSIHAGEITPEMVHQVFTEFELGRKLKREMLQSFVPTQEMIDKKLLEDEEYQELLQADPHSEHERFQVEIAELEDKDRIEKIRSAGDLTEEMTSGLTLREQNLFKPQLDEAFGAGTTENLQSAGFLLLPKEDGEGYLLLKLKSVQNLEPQYLHEKLKKLEKEKEALEKQAVELVRDESFNVIYKEWKKEVDIQINQEVWEEFIVFTLPENKE